MEEIKKKAIIYGLIWSLSYWVVMFSGKFWWEIYSLQLIFLTAYATIWFPYALWNWILGLILPWQIERKLSHFPYPFLISILPILTSILIVYVILKIKQAMK